jgi:hypothetical protein
MSIEGSYIGSGLERVAIVGVLSHFHLDLCSPFLPLFGGHNHGLTSQSAAGYLRRVHITIENRKLRFIFHFIINGPILIRFSIQFDFIMCTEIALNIMERPWIYAFWFKWKIVCSVSVFIEAIMDFHYIISFLCQYSKRYGCFIKLKA